jgi:Xaa-Pro aminopeptidase
VTGGFAVRQDRCYVPGELGIRHEDMVAVTESGCENLAPMVVRHTRRAGRGVNVSLLS